MAVTFVLGLYPILRVTVEQGGEYCYNINDNLFSIGETKWCDYGCCGDVLNQECCGEDVAAVVWIVIGYLAGVAAIVTVIVVICCCLRKQRVQQGQVIGANSNTTATFVTGGSVPKNMYSTPPSGIQYGQPMGYNNAAFPQMQAQAQPPMEQKCGQPPPSYDHVNPN